MSEIVNQFYGAIRSGDVATLEALIDQDFSLICPTQDHVLSGVYRGKHRFFEEVTPHVFGSVEASDITFCAAHEIIVDTGEVVVAMAKNSGFSRAETRYDQQYIHIFKIRDGRIVALIEGFDTALANRALWGSADKLPPDEAAHLSNLQCFMDA
jgi:ketosteroid isomerase-like protein